MRDIERYYQSRFLRFGRTSEGVDWNPGGHYERFEKFVPLFASVNRPFSVLDFGSGYGALADFLLSENFDFSYVGVEIVDESRESGEKRFGHLGEITFSRTVADAIDSEREFDFLVASGTFNVKLEVDESTWKAYVLDNLAQFARVAKFGFSVNFLSANSEEDKREGKLYYAAPGEIESFLSSEVGGKIQLDHSYSPWEFTVTVFPR